MGHLLIFYQIGVEILGVFLGEKDKKVFQQKAFLKGNPGPSSLRGLAALNIVQLFGPLPHFVATCSIFCCLCW